jgi:hypothetical protein
LESLHWVFLCADTWMGDDRRLDLSYVESMGYQAETFDQSIYTLRRRIPVRPVETACEQLTPTRASTRAKRPVLRRLVAALSFSARLPQST